MPCQGRDVLSPFTAEIPEVNRETAGLLVAVAARVNGVRWRGAARKLSHCAWWARVTPTRFRNLAPLILVRPAPARCEWQKDSEAGRGCAWLAKSWRPQALGAQAAFLGCLCPIQQPRHLLCKHSGAPHTMVPASLAAQPDLASASSPPHCPSLWRGAVSGALEGGPRPGTFLQGRKGLLGWLGMPQRMNGHANEMLMSLGQASPESSLGSCPSAARREGSSTPALPLLWADPPAPPQRLSWVERAAHWASRLGLRHSLSSVWSPSLVGPPPQGLTVHSVALGPRDCQCPSAPRCNGAVSPLSRSESRGKSLLGQD